MKFRKVAGYKDSEGRVKKKYGGDGDDHDNAPQKKSSTKAEKKESSNSKRRSEGPSVDRDIKPASGEYQIYVAESGTKRVNGRTSITLDYTVFDSSGVIVDSFKGQSGGFGKGSLPGLTKDYDRGRDTQNFAGMKVDVNALYPFDGDGGKKDPLSSYATKGAYAFENKYGQYYGLKGWSASLETPDYVKSATKRDGFAVHPDGKNYRSEKVDDGTQGCIGIAHKNGDAKRYLEFINETPSRNRPTDIKIVDRDVYNQLVNRSQQIVALRKEPMTAERLASLESAVFEKGGKPAEIGLVQAAAGITVDNATGPATRYAYNSLARSINEHGKVTPEAIADAQKYQNASRTVRYSLERQAPGYQEPAAEAKQRLAGIEPSKYAPVADRETVMTSPFAHRDIERGSRNHRAADYRGAPGDKVIAPYGGKITKIGSISVTYKTENGLTIKDTHVKPVKGMRVGSTFEAGEAISYLGHKGNNGGYAPHLDRSISVGKGIYINPTAIHPEFTYKSQALANRDQNAFYNKSKGTWIKADDSKAIAALGLEKITPSQTMIASAVKVNLDEKPVVETSVAQKDAAKAELLAETNVASSSVKPNTSNEILGQAPATESVVAKNDIAPSQSLPASPDMRAALAAYNEDIAPAKMPTLEDKKLLIEPSIASLVEFDDNSWGVGSGWDKLSKDTPPQAVAQNVVPEVEPKAPEKAPVQEDRNFFSKEQMAGLAKHFPDKENFTKQEVLDMLAEHKDSKVMIRRGDSRKSPEVRPELALAQAVAVKYEMMKEIPTGHYGHNTGKTFHGALRDAQKKADLVYQDAIYGKESADMFTAVVTHEGLNDKAIAQMKGEKPKYLAEKFKDEQQEKVAKGDDVAKDEKDVAKNEQVPEAAVDPTTLAANTANLPKDQGAQLS